MQIALVLVTLGVPTFTNTGLPSSSVGGSSPFLAQPPAPPAVPTYVTVFTPGSNCAAFTFNGGQQAAEPRTVVNSHGAGGGASYGASTLVTLTSPVEQPTAHQRIQIGFIQHGSDTGSSTYLPTGTRNITAPTATTVDWLVTPCTPGATDEWPWYDQSARQTGAGASPWSATLSMTDSPTLFIPSQFNPNNAADPNRTNALSTALETFAFTIEIAVRTLDTALAADTHFFDEGHSTWAVNFAVPVVAGVSIVTTGAAWAAPATPTEVSVNVVPTSTNHTVPFKQWVP
jgi:hypothetical protein